MPILPPRDLKSWLVKEDGMKELNVFVGVNFQTVGDKVIDEYTDLLALGISQGFVQRWGQWQCEMFSDGLGKSANLQGFDCTCHTVAGNLSMSLMFFAGKTLLMNPPPMMPFEAKPNVHLFMFMDYSKWALALLGKLALLLLFRHLLVLLWSLYHNIVLPLYSNPHLGS